METQTVPNSEIWLAKDTASLCEPGKPAENGDTGDDKILKPKVVGEWKVAGVFDGMGGHNGGKVASEIALNTIDGGTNNLVGKGLDQGKEEINQAMKAADEAVAANAALNADLKEMGTTGVVAAIHNNTELLVANVGDSRAYLYRGGKLSRVTQDQTVLVKGKTREEAAKILDTESKNLTPNLQSRIEGSVLTSALGRNASIDFYTVPVQESDIVFLFSDGITDVLTEENIQSIISERLKVGEHLNEIVAALNEEAKRVMTDSEHPNIGRRKSYMDDRSIVAMRVDEEKQAHVTGKLTDIEAEKEPAENEPKSAAEIQALFHGSQSLEQLYSAITEVGSIPTTNNGNFTAAELITCIEEAIKTQNFKFVTREYGLRDIVTAFAVPVEVSKQIIEDTKESIQQREIAYFMRTGSTAELLKMLESSPIVVERYVDKQRTDILDGSKLAWLIDRVMGARDTSKIDYINDIPNDDGLRAHVALLIQKETGNYPPGYGVETVLNPKKEGFLTKGWNALFGRKP